MSTVEATVIDAANAWAVAVEAMTETEEDGVDGNEALQMLETAEFQLYEAVLGWRHRPN